MQLKRLMALTMSVALALASSPFVNVAAQVANPAASSQQTVQATGLTISGTLLKSDRKTPIADGCVRLRKIDTSAIVGRTVSDRTGAYSFLVSEPGMYLVEVVDCDDDDDVLAVSEVLTLAQLPLTALVVVPATAVAAFLSSTAFLVIAAASAAGITAIAVAVPDPPQNVLSPEQ